MKSKNEEQCHPGTPGISLIWQPSGRTSGPTAELLEYLLGLSDIDNQIEKWSQYNPKNKIKFDCLDFVIHFIFDDTVLGEAPEKAIGFYLLNKREAAAVRDVVRNLDIVFKKYGMDEEDSFYIQTDEWRSVVHASKKAYSLIANDAVQNL